MKKIAALLIGASTMLTLLALGMNGAGATPPAPQQQQATKVVDRKTDVVKGVTSPKGPGDVAWPQSYLATVPNCGGFWIQRDTYKYDGDAKTKVDALIAGKVLNSKNDDSSVYISSGFIYVTPCITDVKPCTTVTDGTKITDKSAFVAGLSDTRSAGHYEFTDTGLHVYTDDATSNAKVPEYSAPDTSWSACGTPSLSWTGTQPQPGFQLVVDLTGDGTPDGIIVGE